MLIHAHVLKHLSIIVIFDIHRRQRALNNYSENNELTNQGARAYTQIQSVQLLCSGT